MNRKGLILLQTVGALSLLPYPVVLLANIMSIAAPGHTLATSIPWILLSLYPLVWIALYLASWRAMARGAVRLAFGLSSIPALSCAAAIGIYILMWIRLGLGMAGIGNGGLQVHTLTTSNPLIDSIELACQDIQFPGPVSPLERALREIDGNPALINVRVPVHGSPLNVVLSSLSIGVDGSIHGDLQRQQERIRLVRVLVEHGAHLAAGEATDLRKSWLLRRALYDGPVTTASENSLVWRIVTHRQTEPKPFNPLTDKLPPRIDSPARFQLKEDERRVLNTVTQLHGTPLYAALLDNAKETCRVIIEEGGRLSPEEEHDTAAAAALQTIFDSDPDLRAAYNKVR